MPEEEERFVMEQLEEEDRHRIKRERWLVGSILVIGILIAILVGREVTRIDEGYKSIRCERGQNVTLVLTKLDGTVERVSCPTEVEVRR